MESQVQSLKGDLILYQTQLKQLEHPVVALLLVAAILQTGQLQVVAILRGATIVTTGATTGYMAKTDLRHIFFKGINILGSTQGTRAELEQGLFWMSQGKIKAIIDSVYSLEQATEAHNKMLKGKGLFGKILMKP